MYPGGLLLMLWFRVVDRFPQKGGVFILSGHEQAWRQKHLPFPKRKITH
jgi:hypothetical protein